MKELFRTNDPVLLSFATALLAEQRIEAVVLDGHTSILEGSIGAIQRRLMVRDEDLVRARRLLKERGGPVDGV
ncbi:MAG: DUF2007 domain-containing protein [Alphaproteobacteria bacterium]